ncbi:MAG: hypothetical protein LPK85_00845, partial [Gammaproteobacteria bacterium]|nr:hypothetical protein [Gammaproteobacteria bacterium]
RSKFTDPRNADRLLKIDARECIACHREHQLEQTGPMGVTLPTDFCFHCHQDIAEERPSHAGMAFDTCAASGCHNYHDNRALYESFLVAHAQQPVLNALGRVLARTPDATKVFAVPVPDAPAAKQTAEVLADWHASAHAAADVNCQDCHRAAQASDAHWIETPDMAVCESCHAPQVQGFVQGKHGMRQDPRLSTSLSPMTPAEGRLDFQSDAAHTALTCLSCHGAHRFDTRAAAVQGCLSCHADEHSLAYLESPHARAWQAEQRGEADPGSGVSCATCHMPRELQSVNGHERVVVNHNQSANLRPNEKMIRSVCQDCHGLPFVIDALADPTLIQRNFTGQPARHIPSVDMAVQREGMNPE